MYHYIQIIYGIPLVNGKGKPSQQLEEAIEDEEPGFETFYSGDAVETPACVGVILGDIEPTKPWNDVAALPLTPTTLQYREFQQLWNQINPVLQKEITKKFGAPRVHFLWVTS